MLTRLALLYIVCWDKSFSGISEYPGIIKVPWAKNKTKKWQRQISAVDFLHPWGVQHLSPIRAFGVRWARAAKAKVNIGCWDKFTVLDCHQSSTDENIFEKSYYLVKCFRDFLLWENRNAYLSKLKYTYSKQFCSLREMFYYLLIRNCQKNLYQCDWYLFLTKKDLKLAKISTI